MILLETSISNFLFHCQYQKNLNYKTIKAYTIDLKQFVNSLDIELKDKLVSEVSKEEIKTFLTTISNKKSKTIKRKIAALKALFNYLMYEEIIEINPFTKLKINIKSTTKLPVVMDINEIKKILTYCHKEKERIANKESNLYKTNLRDLAVLEMLFTTGVRVSELVNLKLHDVDLKNDEIKIFGKGGKERIIQICNKETIQILCEYFKTNQAHISSNNYFFVNKLKKKLSDQSVRAIVKRYARLANIQKHITPHTYRHTFATLLLEQGVDIKYIQNLLGHSSITTTQIYTHISNKKLRDVLIKKHPRQLLNLVL